MDRSKKMALVGLIAAALVIMLAIWFLVLLLSPGSHFSEDTQPTPSQTTDLPEQMQPSTSRETSPGTQDTTTPETTEQTQTTAPSAPEDRDPQTDGQMSGGTGADVDVSQTITENETAEVTFGIDVSKYQGTIDWARAAESGIDFAMIRVGYRTTADGTITADTNARYNMQEAQKHGIRIGAYFFSSAVTREEAIEEANWVADYIAQYAITYPVAYDCEGFTDPDSRQYGLTKTQRTDLALAFLETIARRGYSPMFYASRSELEGEAQWETSRIGYKIWVAQYPAAPYPQTPRSNYTGAHHMWQFTTQGSVPGISQPVDVNIAYFGFTETNDPQNTQPPETVDPDPEALMVFAETNETVTAKIETNLRDMPSQGSESTVMYTLKNGETALRIGISDSGWSKVVFNGSTFYAVSSYLTTDLDYQVPPPTTEPDDGIETVFTPVNEQVTAKEVVNLRSKPSVTDPESVVVVQLHAGEIALRTGINTDVGWSRVEFNGQVLYCISSYLTTPQP